MLEAVTGEKSGLDEFEMVNELSRVTGKACPPQLAGLKEKAVRFDRCCEKAEMDAVVFEMLNI